MDHYRWTHYRSPDLYKTRKHWMAFNCLWERVEFVVIISDVNRIAMILILTLDVVYNISIVVYLLTLDVVYNMSTVVYLLP